MQKSKLVKRDQNAMSLVEMVTAIFIMTFVAAAITELCVSQNVVAFRTFNKLGNLINARRAMTMLERDVRMASLFLPSYTPDAGQAPSNDAVADWPAPPYQIDEQTLILRRPDFGVGSPLPSGTKVVVFKLLADKRQPGKGMFVLQKKEFPGGAPQTVLTGVVGPIDPNGTQDPLALTPIPKTFGYISMKSPLYSQNLISDKPSDSADTRGVSMSIELQDLSASTRKDLVPKSLAFKKEVYARGNLGKGLSP